MIYKGNNAAGAVFSDCMTYRYQLWRRLDPKPWPHRGPTSRCMFLMLNPSTADEAKLDNTVRRCFRFAEDWGYAYVDVGNLFALRSTDPAALYRDGHDPVGPDNDAMLLLLARAAQQVVCAWGGTHGHHLRRAQGVANMLRSAGVKLYALRLCADGTPGHPLYLPKQLEPQPWA